MIEKGARDTIYMGRGLNFDLKREIEKDPIVKKVTFKSVGNSRSNTSFDQEKYVSSSRLTNRVVRRCKLRVTARETRISVNILYSNESW